MKATRTFNTATARLLALWAERWCYRPDRVRTFAAVSNGVASELAAYYAGIPIRVVPNGVDSQRFRPSAKARADLRKELSTDPNAIVALFVGGDWDRKGLAMAIGAAAATRSLGQPISLWVLGRGDKSRFQELASKLGVADSVTFFGSRSDTERFYQAADVFVLPSAYETFSLVCFEAAACGLPLVIPRISGASELVGDDEAGLIVDRDTRLIGESLVKLASDDSLRKRLGATAQERAAQFTWEATAEAFLDVVISLLPPIGNRT